MKALVIGHSSYDIACPVNEYPIENTKYRLDEVVMCGGGPAGNAAYLLGKWGVDTYIAGVVGSDDYGNKIRKEFENIGVHTDYLETNYEQPTSLSFIMINKNTGSRTLFNIANSRPNMKKSDFNIDPDVILVDGHEYNASLSALNKYPNAICIIDAGRITPELMDLCKYCKYIVTSKGFAETTAKMKFDFSNPNTLVQIFTIIKNKYPKSEVVITLEDKGCLYQVNNEIKIMPGLKVKPADTTGAGDIFHGAFTYAVSRGFDIEKCVRFSNIAAGLSVEKVGARLSIPSLEVTNYYNEKFPSNGAVEQAPSQDVTNQETVQAPQQAVHAPVQEQAQVQTPVQDNVQPNVQPDVFNQQPVAAPSQQQGSMSYEQAIQTQLNNNNNAINGGNING